MVNHILYLIAVLIWLYYGRGPETKIFHIVDILMALEHDLQALNEGASRFNFLLSSPPRFKFDFLSDSPQFRDAAMSSPVCLTHLSFGLDMLKCSASYGDNVTALMAVTTGMHHGNLKTVRLPVSLVSICISHLMAPHPEQRAVRNKLVILAARAIRNSHPSLLGLSAVCHSARQFADLPRPTSGSHRDLSSFLARVNHNHGPRSINFS